MRGAVAPRGLEFVEHPLSADVGLDALVGQGRAGNVAAQLFQRLAVIGTAAYGSVQAECEAVRARRGMPWPEQAGNVRIAIAVGHVGRTLFFDQHPATGAQTHQSGINLCNTACSASSLGAGISVVYSSSNSRPTAAIPIAPISTSRDCPTARFVPVKASIAQITPTQFDRCAHNSGTRGYASRRHPLTGVERKLTRRGGWRRRFAARGSRALRGGRENQAAVLAAPLLTYLLIAPYTRSCTCSR